MIGAPTLENLEESDVLIFIGADPCATHPEVWQRVLKHRHNPEIIVVDPRTTPTALAATQHYAIAPGTECALLNGLANLLIASHWIDRAFIDAHTSRFAEFVDFVAQFTPDRVSAASGISVDRLWHLAQTIADGKRVSFWWTMGVCQGYEATPTAQAIINLALLTGSIGHPGARADSAAGQ